MDRWIRRLIGLFMFIVCFMLGIVPARAVALGKIKVTSHLGEMFAAKIPMQLEANEHISSVFVTLASPAEYRILEVYRDPALNAIRSDVKHDSRGARVELSSDSVMDAPFFNLILKVRHGYATQFKKYPVFLNLLRVKPVRIRTLPEVSTVHSQVNTGRTIQPDMPVMAAHSTAKTEAERIAKPAFKPYDGWARTGRYGPMVYGDTIRTVALRLRVDARYTLPQVMMALFNKNRKKFNQGNVNLINAGTWLDVPKASEVEKLTPAEASKLLAMHNRVWNALKKQHRYTAIAEAQQHRYKTRVRMSKMAIGVVSSRASGTESRERPGAETRTGQPAETGARTTAGVPETAALNATQQAKLGALQQENTLLQEDIKTADDKISALSDKLASAGILAANARIKRLEFSLARLQAELDRSRQAAQSSGGVPRWPTYLLGSLVILLLASLGYLLRRERPHPAVALTSANATTVTPPHEDEVHRFEELAQQVSVAERSDRATIQTNTREAEDVPPDNTPRLMEPDTTKAETSREGVSDPPPEPTVDYMAEADIYLRYGMEDEAIDQMRMAIKQHPDHAEAYIALIRTLRSKGDQTALQATIEAGHEALTGEELQAFEADTALADKDEAGGIPDTEFGSMELDDLITIPDTGITPNSLYIDKARSLLAEGALDEAESSFKAAVNVDNTRGDALLGLADVAQHRGDATKATEFLAEAKMLVDDSNRDWFEAIRRKTGSSE